MLYRFAQKVALIPKDRQRVRIKDTTVLPDQEIKLLEV